MDKGTEVRMDQRTDKAAYRDAKLHLKINNQVALLQVWVTGFEHISRTRVFTQKNRK